MSDIPLPSSKSSILQKLLERPSVEFAILYGSQATGDDTESSDIDIGLMFTDIDSVEPYTIIFRIEEEYCDAGFDDLELDLSVLNTAEEKDFIRTVKEQAIPLAGNEEKARAYSYD